MTNQNNFVIWLEGYLEALESEGIEVCNIHSIKSKMETIKLQHFAKKIYSQNGEDGITIKLIEMLYDKPNNKNYVEFGVENGDECNTRILLENYGWKGLLMDGGYYNTHKNLQLEFITKENILELLKKYNVPKDINLLSVDIDMNDWHVMKEIIAEYTIDIIIAEYNAHIPPTEAKVVPYNSTSMWDGTDWYGASLLAFNKLLQPAGYTLVCCDPKGVNSFFVRTSLLEERKISIDNAGDVKKLYNPPNFKYYPGKHPPDGLKRGYINL
tara:strand:+ start:124 stop:930 length:807 start_codon:yes stop_codon:yes gene_type:complete